jgi:hypothetical protein
MRSKPILGVLIFLTASAAAAQSQQHTFAIYLLARPIDTRTLAQDQGQWKQLSLASVPVISDADIISYDFSNHAMRLGPGAINRLPKPPVTGTPFVIVVNGERIYQGAFYTSLSSISYTEPVIVVDNPEPTRPRQVDVLTIDRGYPAKMARGEDRRSDERIRTALSKLGKLASFQLRLSTQAVEQISLAQVFPAPG